MDSCFCRKKAEEEYRKKEDQKHKQELEDRWKKSVDDKKTDGKPVDPISPKQKK